MDLSDLLRPSSHPVRLRARWVLPIDRPPIIDGEVEYEDGVLTYVGRARPEAPTADLGLSAILPGFVNVHAHLEYTALRGLVEDRDFFSWIRALTALKAYVDQDDWVASATLGAAEMAAAGITTLGDASDAGATVSALIASGLRGIVFREAFGIEREPSTSVILDVLKRRIATMRTQLVRAGAGDRVALGISPHASYTVRPDLFAALARYAEDEGFLQTIHADESPAEEALVRVGSGPFKEMFDRRGIAWTAPGTSSIGHIAASSGFRAPTLAVHCVHVDADDALTMARHGVSVAHCPRSNGKLGAGVAPLRMLREAGLDIGLGTDSMVSANAVDFFEEMRAAAYGSRAREQDPRQLTAAEALRMATLGGARAMHWEGRVGSLTTGKRADLCVVRMDGLHLVPAADDAPEAALVYAARASDVALTVVDGQVVYDNGRFPRLDIARLRQSVHLVRRKVRAEGQTILGTT